MNKVSVAQVDSCLAVDEGELMASLKYVIVRRKGRRRHRLEDGIPEHSLFSIEAIPGPDDLGCQSMLRPRYSSFRRGVGSIVIADVLGHLAIAR